MTASERAAYRQALEQARAAFTVSRKRLSEIFDEQQTLETEIANLRKTITALSAMCSENPALDKLGITESVIQTMAVTHYSWTTAEVVNNLNASGFDLSTQKNAQASVHAVLARLAQQGKIKRVTNAKKNESGNAYEWRGPKYNAKADLEAGYCNPPSGGPPSVTAPPTEDDDDGIPF